MTIYMVSISNDPSTSETIDDPSALSNVILVMKKKYFVDVFVNSECIHLYILCIVPRRSYRENH